MKKEIIEHKLTCNYSKRTYTIRKYCNGKLIAKYRSFPQSKEEFSDNWTEMDIRNYLKNGYNSDYYLIK